MTAVPPPIFSDVDINSIISNKFKVSNQVKGNYSYWKLVVKAATTTNINISGIQTIDDVSLIIDDRVLVKNQTNAIENGIYYVRNGVWLRTDDFPLGYNATGSITYVSQGTVNKQIYYYCTSGIVGTSSLVYKFFTSITDSLSPSGILNSIQISTENGNTGYSSFTYDNDTSTILIGKTSQDIIIQTKTFNDQSIDFQLNVVSKSLQLSSGNGPTSGDLYIQTGGNPISTRNGNGGSITITTGNNYATDYNVDQGRINFTTGVAGVDAGDINIITSNSNLSTVQPDITLTTYYGSTYVSDNSLYYSAIRFYNSYNTTSLVRFGYDRLIFETFGSSTIANPGIGSATINSRQGFLTITDPSSLTAGNGADITITCDKCTSSSYIFTAIKSFPTFQNPADSGIYQGIPSVYVKNLSNGSFVLRVTNIGTLTMDSSPLIINYIIF